MIIINIDKNKNFKLRAFVYNNMYVAKSFDDSTNAVVSIRSVVNSAISEVSYMNKVSIQNDELFLPIKIVK
jgi:hypothetical protein